MEISRAMTKLQETCRALGRRLERFVGRPPDWVAIIAIILFWSFVAWTYFLFVFGVVLKF